jgi:hypothetical protein
MFETDKIEYLAHVVGGTGVWPSVNQKAAMAQMAQPTCMRWLQAFLGLVNFFRRFLFKIAGVLVPLTDTLKGSIETDKRWYLFPQGNSRAAKV